MILAALLLLSGLAISAVAIYYSVVGLTAIFSAAAIPIMIMGVSLEVGKLVIASWVKAYWTRIPFLMKSYAVVGVTVLMIITSLGIFGFLSKAHSDQTLVSGDVQSKIAVYDEKIKIAKENIEANRRALKQMDEAVDQSMARSNDEKGADKAVAIRRGQQKERQRLQAEIAAEQTKISQLSDERAPIAAEIRKVEAEVGPIKYIAAFVYGDNPDASILERAVTWVIILIVIVFDPLAVVMLLAAQMTWSWQKEPEQDKYDHIVASGSGPTVDEMIEQEQEEPATESDVGDQQAPAYLGQPFTHFENLQPMPAPHVEPEPKLEIQPFDVVENGPNWTLITENAVPEPDTTEVDQLKQELNDANGNVYELANYVQNLQQDYSVVTDLHQKSMGREADLIEENASLKEALELALAENDDRNAMSITMPPEVETRPFTEHESEALNAYNDERLVTIFDKLDLKPGVPEPIANHPELQAAIKSGLENGTLEIRGSYEEPDDQEDSASEAELAPISQPEPELELQEEDRSVGITKDTQAEDIKPSEGEPEILKMGIDVTERPGDYITDPVANLFTKYVPKNGFGNNFPDNPRKGDLFLRVDFNPSRLFKWNDTKWIEVNKHTTTAYVYNDAYLQYLAEQVLSGNQSWDDLTETEQEQVQSMIGGRRG